MKATAIAIATAISLSSSVTQAAGQLLWGDTHLHTNLSSDAFGFGVRLGPEEAYRFAIGEVVTSSHGLKVQLDRPLDFVVIADHAESLGIIQRVADGDPALMQDATAARWHAQMRGTPEEQAEFASLFFDGESRRGVFDKLDELATAELSKDIWKATLAIGERYNQPGNFTTLLGYEWTAGDRGNNLHRVVIHRDNAETVGKLRPFSQSTSNDPQALWAHLSRYEEETGGKVLAIPHNGNLSNGTMFPVESTFNGSPVDEAYSRQRARWEPVYEVTQMKGDGETHPLLSPDDAFADYETWDSGNFFGVPKTPAMLPGEYARAALRNGLQIERRTGSNPYRFGMIGSTDSHTGLSTADEDNFFGKHSGVEPGPERWQHLIGSAGDWKVLGWEQVASGLAAVWAENNSRGAIWDALQRREVYATTGPRISVRLFAGWDFSEKEANSPDMATLGYAHGVPMGGTLRRADSDRGAPTLLVAASRDPEGANLDRIQIIKGWIDEDGATHEKVYDIAWSQPDTRQRQANGELPTVGNTVNIAQADYSNTIGATQLNAFWQDPAFDPAQGAFYYARVLQIPTPRWTAFDARRYGIEMPEEIPMTTVERAYTSPVWYQP